MNSIPSVLAQWREHPAQMVRELFHVEPDPWQQEVLEAFPHNQRIAMPAAKGPGKSTVLAWIGWNFLLTRPHPKIGATSVSATNLQDGLWAEMAKWQHKAPFLKANFTWTKTRIFANEAPETWFMAAKAWSQSADSSQQANTLAGFHADYVLFLIDETGSMPRAIMVTAEAALAGCIEAHIVQAGNPTSREGALYHACQIARDLWYVMRITGDPDDPNRSPRIPVAYAREQIQQYGRDNPWVKCNIFGEFPPSSFNALIGDDEVEAAMKRYYSEFHIGQAPRIMAADVARDGADASVIARRHGLQMHPFKKYRNIDSTQGAGAVAREWTDWGADGCFVDMTGGFGAGWYDQLIIMRRSPIGVQFAGEAHNSQRYFNKRAEMAFDFVEWIKRGGALPRDERLAAALTQTTYTFKGDRFLLEPKEDVKTKIGYSPDEFDAAMMTFAEPIQMKGGAIHRSQSQPPYDPFADFDKMLQANRGDSGYDPLA